MNIRNFEELISEARKMGRTKIAVAAADDEEVLAAIRQAQDEGFAQGILVGNEENIQKIAKAHNIWLKGFEIIPEPDPFKAATKCCQLIREGSASVIMKGLLDTSLYMKAILNKETGLNAGGLLSHVALFELEHYPKLLMVTDAAINIAPDINAKVRIIQNAVSVLRSIGTPKPLVACVCAVEKINTENMPCTLDAAILAKMSDHGQIKDCIVDGPFGLDNAVSEESARIKKIVSPVAGHADIILCNDIESGNYLYKALSFLAMARSAAVVAGATAPVVLTSRADSHETKYHSIALGVLSSKK